MTKSSMHYYIIITCLLLFSIPSQSQNNRYATEVTSIIRDIEDVPDSDLARKDSLLRVAAGIAREHCNDSIRASVNLFMSKNFKLMSLPDSAGLYLDQALNIIAEDEDLDALKSSLYQAYSDLKNFLGESDSVKFYLDSALLYANASRDSALIIGNLADMARYYSNNGQSEAAIKILNQIEPYQIRNEKYYYLKHLYNQLGVCYFRINAVDAAKETFQKGLNIYSEDEEKVNLHLYNNLGQLHSTLLNQQDSAIYFYNKSSDLAKKYNHTYSWLVAMLNMGNCYEIMEQFREAEKIYLSVLRSEHISSYHIVKTAVTINLGIIYYSTEQYESARFYIEEGLQMAREAKYLDFEINALKYKTLLSSYYNNHKQLEEDFEILYQRVDSSYNLSHSDEISELKVQYETEKAAQENDNLKAQGELNRKIISNQRTMLYLLVLGVICLISLVVFVIFQNKKQKKLSAKLQVSNITKDKLFSVVAHDLKSPMSAILTTLTIIDDDTLDLDESQFKAIVKELKQNVENSSLLLTNLLQWSQNQRFGIQNKPETVNLNAISLEVYNLLSPKAKNKNIDLSLHIDKDFSIWCDPMLFKNSLINILNNAIKFTQQGGKIAINANNENGMTKICVTDNGIGIPKEHQSKLFHIETGYHTDGTANEKGTGLGLAMCKEYVDVMGGEISVESTPGKGSTFCFTIPVTK